MQIQGLTELDVREKIKKGLVNDFKITSSKKISHILRDNIFTFFNVLISPIIILLIYFSLCQALISVAGIALLNTIIGIIQEIRAKIALDKISLIDARKTIVIRDGVEKEININEIVEGEYIKIKSGEPVLADGIVIYSNYCEIDESMLTGESDYIKKNQNDEVLSGSYCVSGEAIYIAKKIGENSYVNKMSLQTKKYRKFLSPIQIKINYIIKFMIFCGISLIILMAMKYFINLKFNIQNANPVDTVSAIAIIIVTLIPQGLVLSVTLIFIIGIVRMSKTGALIQKPNAIESMAHINVLCMDKTGTLTQNKISLKKLIIKNENEENIIEYLKTLAGTSIEKNKTMEAVYNKYGEIKIDLIDIIPFTSKRKFTAIRYKKDSEIIDLCFGAFEVLEPFFDYQNNVDLKNEISNYSNEGFRVLILLKKTSKNNISLSDDLKSFNLLSIILFEDELKPEADKILNYFNKRGIELKIISGDNPETVKSIANRLNIKNADKTITGAELDKYKNSDFDRIVQEKTIFARVIPEQKLQIIKSLQTSGYYVAMVGDGVNDALAIKEAYLGICMGSGARITKDVAEIVLIKDSFEIMPQVLSEGQNIIQNIKDISKLFLFKNIYSILLIIISQFLNFVFPFSPQQITLINFFIITLPSLYISLYSKKKSDMDKNYIHNMIEYAINSAFITTICVIIGILVVMFREESAIFVIRTYVICIISIMGINGFIYISNYNNKVSDFFKPKFFIAGIVFISFLPIAMYSSNLLRAYFEIIELNLKDWLIILLISASGIISSYFVCKYNLIFKFLTYSGKDINIK